MGLPRSCDHACCNRAVSLSVGQAGFSCGVLFARAEVQTWPSCVTNILLPFDNKGLQKMQNSSQYRKASSITVWYAVTPFSLVKSTNASSIRIASTFSAEVSHVGKFVGCIREVGKERCHGKWEWPIKTRGGGKEGHSSDEPVGNVSPEECGTTFLRNVGNYPLNYTASHPRTAHIDKYTS